MKAFKNVVKKGEKAVTKMMGLDRIVASVLVLENQKIHRCINDHYDVVVAIKMMLNSYINKQTGSHLTLSKTTSFRLTN